MRPLKNSCSAELPPIDSGPVEVGIVPGTALLATCVPFTYRRSVAPSYVVATCDHVLAGSAAVPRTSSSPLVNTCPLGGPAPVLP